ncbi:MAG: hypothetical protein AB7H90_02945 [Alphaproteobacteria bacterium]
MSDRTRRRFLVREVRHDRDHPGCREDQGPVSPGGGAAAPPSNGGAGGAGGALGAPVFADTLPADIRTDPVFRDIKDLEGLARGYQGQARLMGIPKDRLLELPADPGNAEAMGKVYDRLGRPEAPDRYAFKTDALPEGVTIDEPTMGWFRQTVHSLGLSQRQAAALFEAWNAHVGERVTGQQQQSAQAHEAAIGALKTEWGAAFDEKLRVAKDALAHYGGDKAAEIASRYGSDPDLARIFAEVGKVLQEHGMIGRGTPGSAATLSPTEAQQEINAKYADPEFIKRMQSRDRQVRDAATAELERLFKMAYPEQNRAA